MQNTSSLAMSKMNSIKKLKIDFIEETDGSATLHIKWDETDPDLQWWTDLGEEGQKSFMIKALANVCNSHVD